MNYVILRKFLDKHTCNSIIASCMYINTPQESLGLLDGDDKTNIWYKSKRSLGLEYKYQKDANTMNLQKNIKKELTNTTGIDFSGGINELCLPICKYNDGGEIKVHRDIDKVGNLNKPVEYVVICMLTQVGIDFNFNTALDNLYINFDKPSNIDTTSKVSTDGKEVEEATISQRLYPNLQKGDVIIFKNSNSVHGVHSIKVLNSQIGRITCGFRSK